MHEQEPRPSKGPDDLLGSRPPTTPKTNRRGHRSRFHVVFGCFPSGQDFLSLRTTPTSSVPLESSVYQGHHTTIVELLVERPRLPSFDRDIVAG